MVSHLFEHNVIKRIFLVAFGVTTLVAARPAAGQFCNTGPTCTTNGDCLLIDPDLPECVNGQCRQCSDVADCTSGPGGDECINGVCSGLCDTFASAGIGANPLTCVLPGASIVYTASIAIPATLPPPASPPCAAECGQLQVTQPDGNVCTTIAEVGLLLRGDAVAASCGTQYILDPADDTGPNDPNGIADGRVEARVEWVDAISYANPPETGGANQANSVSIGVDVEVDPPTGVICEGDAPVQFCAVVSAGNHSFSWTGPGGFTATTQCITVGVAGTYTVTANYNPANGCSDMASGTLTVSPNPTCNVDPPSAAICAGDPGVQFCAQPSGGQEPYSFLWNTGATTQCITTDVAGSYSVTVTDANGCDGSCDTQLTVNPCGVLECRVTGGGNDSYQGNKYTRGGQAGASDSDHGEWTHHQKSGPDHRFVFHAGTSSAPDETEIHIVTCSDPDNCNPARPAPAKQIDFEGTGQFKNIHGYNAPVGEAVAGETFHWFEVHIEDLGEPGSNNPEPDADCPDEGSQGELADCGCPDFYTITIYRSYDPATESPNMTDVIYHVHGYMNGGNHQIHPSLD